MPFELFSPVRVGIARASNRGNSRILSPQPGSEYVHPVWPPRQDTFRTRRLRGAIPVPTGRQRIAIAGRLGQPIPRRSRGPDHDSLAERTQKKSERTPQARAHFRRCLVLSWATPGRTPGTGWADKHGAPWAIQMISKSTCATIRSGDRWFTPLPPISTELHATERSLAL